MDFCFNICFNDSIIGHLRYYLSNDGRNVFYQPIIKKIRTNEKVRKIFLGQGDDYTTGCLLDNNYFLKSYNMIIIDLSKQ